MSYQSAVLFYAAVGHEILSINTPIFAVTVAFVQIRFDLYLSQCSTVCYILAILDHGPLNRYVILRVAHAPGMPGTFPPLRLLQRKPLVSDPGMHHGTCVTYVPWCMSGSFTRGGGENVRGIPGACAPAILRIWQEAHGVRSPNCTNAWLCEVLWSWHRWQRQKLWIATVCLFIHSKTWCYGNRRETKSIFSICKWNVAFLYVHGVPI